MWLLACALAACGSSPAIQKADDARSQGLRDQAARDYAEALRTTKLTPNERGRALANIRELTEEMVSQDAVAWATSDDPLSVAEPLARLRGRVNKLNRPAVSAAYTAVVASYLERNRPALDRLRQAHRYVEAMALASALTTPLETEDPRNQVLREVSEEAKAWHLAQATAAQGQPVAVQFHVGLAHRFGAEVAGPLKAAVSAGQTAGAVGWDLASAGGDCGKDLQDIVASLGTTGALRLRAEFRGVRCRTDEKAYTKREAYTYQVAYQVQDRGRCRMAKRRTRKPTRGPNKSVTRCTPVGPAKVRATKTGVPRSRDDIQ